MDNVLLKHLYNVSMLNDIFQEFKERYKEFIEEQNYDISNTLGLKRETNNGISAKTYSNLISITNSINSSIQRILRSKNKTAMFSLLNVLFTVKMFVRGKSTRTKENMLNRFLDMLEFEYEEFIRSNLYKGKRIFIESNNSVVDTISINKVRIEDAATELHESMLIKKNKDINVINARNGVKSARKLTDESIKATIHLTKCEKAQQRCDNNIWSNISVIAKTIIALFAISKVGKSNLSNIKRAIKCDITRSDFRIN